MRLPIPVAIVFSLWITLGVAAQSSTGATEIPFDLVEPDEASPALLSAPLNARARLALLRRTPGTPGGHLVGDAYADDRDFDMRHAWVLRRAFWWRDTSGWILGIAFRSSRVGTGVALYEVARPGALRVVGVVGGRRPSVTGAVFMLEGGSALAVVNRRFERRGDRVQTVRRDRGRLAIENSWIRTIP